MKNLLKDIIRPIYNCYLNPFIKEEYRLLNKFGNTPRFVRIDNLKFLSYEISCPDFASFINQYHDIYIDDIYNFKSDNKEPTIIDCGSNIGISLLYFAGKFPAAKIFGFEADENIFKVSKLNLEKNNICNVSITNSAVWIDSGGVEFSLEGADGGSMGGGGKKIKINSMRLKDILLSHPDVDMLKIDIEGSEEEVLVDCQDSLSNVKNIFVEYHSRVDNDQKLDTILNILSKNNFRYFINNPLNFKKPSDVPKIFEMDLQLNIFGFKKL